MLGQEYDGKADKVEFVPGFNPLQSYSGKISQVEFWNTILTPLEVQKLANCDISTTKSQNRILTWKIDDWKLSGEQTTISDVPLTEFCQKNVALNQFIWPRKISFEKFSSYCNLIDGIPPLIYKDSQQTEVYNDIREVYLSINKTFPSSFLDKTRSEGIRCFSSKASSASIDFWLGMKWDQNERKWYSPFKPLDDFSEFKQEIWQEGYNCGYISNDIFYNAPCVNTYPCGMCKFPQDKLVYLKGFCNSGYDIFDFQYYIYGVKNNRPYFK